MEGSYQTSDDDDEIAVSNLPLCLKHSQPFDDSESGEVTDALLIGKQAKIGKKRINNYFPEHTLKVLWGWYSCNMDKKKLAYPSKQEKEQLCTETGLTVMQLNNFMSNARRRQTITSRNVNKYI